MTRDEARVLADATTDALLKATGMTVDPEIRQVMRNWILRALDQALTPSRVQAAERAFVMEALPLVLRNPSEMLAGLMHSGGCAVGDSDTAPCNCDVSKSREAALRLRALREQLQVEECGHIYNVRGEDDIPTSVGACRLPLGHEGRHESEFQW